MNYIQEPEQDNQVIIERFRALPPVIQNIIVNSHWEQKIRAISGRNNLVIGDADILERNTFLVMLGVISPNEYIDILREEIKLDESTLNSIVSSVEEDIFKNIRETLVQISEAKEEDSDNQDLVRKNEMDNIGQNYKPNISENITRESITSEMSEHLEILPDHGEEKDTILEQKLLEPVEARKQNYSIENTPQMTTKKDVVDPYREPIN